MTRPAQEFRDFVAGFADPLARLAFLLSAGTELDSGGPDGVSAGLGSPAMARRRGNRSARAARGGGVAVSPPAAATRCHGCRRRFGGTRRGPHRRRTTGRTRRPRDQVSCRTTRSTKACCVRRRGRPGRPWPHANGCRCCSTTSRSLRSGWPESTSRGLRGRRDARRLSPTVPGVPFGMRWRPMC